MALTRKFATLVPLTVTLYLAVVCMIVIIVISLLTGVDTNLNIEIAEKKSRQLLTLFSI